jgi:hypothetical protein
MTTLQRFLVTMALASTSFSVGCERGTVARADGAYATEEESEAIPVGSREYKVLLDTSRFSGDPDLAAALLEAEIIDLVEENLDRPHEGTLTELDKQRTVWFLDTPGSCMLRSQGYALRERFEDEEREVTLKFRSPDRYLAANADVSADSDDAETKLEEDIKPPHASVFSQSTKVEVSLDAAFERFEDTSDLFPGLDDLDVDDDAPLALVGGLQVYERVYGELEVDLGKQEADLEITLWYASPDDAEPAVAELSFKYKSKTEDYQPKSVRRGMRLFELLQGLDWIATDSTTKTAFVYGYAPTFCGDDAESP